MSKVGSQLGDEVRTMFHTGAFAAFRGLLSTEVTFDEADEAVEAFRELIRDELFDVHLRSWKAAILQSLSPEARIGDVWVYPIERALTKHWFGRNNPFADYILSFHAQLSSNDSLQLDASDFSKFLCPKDDFDDELVSTEFKQKIASLFVTAVLDRANLLFLDGYGDIGEFTRILDISELRHHLPRNFDSSDIRRQFESLKQHPNTVDMVASYSMGIWRHSKRFLRAWLAL